VETSPSASTIKLKIHRIIFSSGGMTVNGTVLYHLINGGEIRPRRWIHIEAIESISKGS
jgi:hypothetical protein